MCVCVCVCVRGSQQYLLIYRVVSSGLATCFHAELIYSSETSVDFQQTTRRYIPEDSTFHNHRSENFKSNVYWYGPYLTKW
jgi:hypothetical protein